MPETPPSHCTPALHRQQVHTSSAAITTHKARERKKSKKNKCLTNVWGANERSRVVQGQCLVTRWDLDKVGLFRSLQPSDSEGQRIVMTAIRWENSLFFTILIGARSFISKTKEELFLFEESFYITFRVILMTFATMS